MQFAIAVLLALVAVSSAQDDVCRCTLQYQPVCGTDGVTYSNACLARCAGMLEFTEGICEETIRELTSHFSAGSGSGSGSGDREIVLDLEDVEVESGSGAESGSGSGILAEIPVDNGDDGEEIIVQGLFGGSGSGEVYGDDATSGLLDDRDLFPSGSGEASGSGSGSGSGEVPDRLPTGGNDKEFVIHGGAGTASVAAASGGSSAGLIAGILAVTLVVLVVAAIGLRRYSTKASAAKKAVVFLQWDDVNISVMQQEPQDEDDPANFNAPQHAPETSQGLVFDVSTSTA